MIMAIDGTNWTHVLWHALSGDCHGIRQSLRRRVDLIHRTWPQVERLVLAFDAAPTFRHQLHTGYKATRRGSPAQLKLLLAQLDEEARTWSDVVVISEDGFEADDVMATVARFGVESGRQVVLASPDKDLRQCLRERQVSILKHWKVVDGVIVPEWETAGKLRTTFGLSPQQWIDYQCLVGDKSDNIPGVTGIGEVLARRLLAEHVSLDTILANPWCCNVSPRQRQNLFRFVESVDVVRQLVRLVDRVPFVEDALDIAPAGASGGAR